MKRKIIIYNNKEDDYEQRVLKINDKIEIEGDYYHEKIDVYLEGFIKGLIFFMGEEERLIIIEKEVSSNEDLFNQLHFYNPSGSFTDKEEKRKMFYYKFTTKLPFGEKIDFLSYSKELSDNRKKDKCLSLASHYEYEYGGNISSQEETKEIFTTCKEITIEEFEGI